MIPRIPLLKQKTTNNLTPATSQTSRIPLLSVTPKVSQTATTTETAKDLRANQASSLITDILKRQETGLKVTTAKPTANIKVAQPAPTPSLKVETQKPILPSL